MSKYNVYLEFNRYVDDVEANNEQEAIKRALYNIIDNPYDFFTDTDKIIDAILSSMNDSCEAEVVE